MTGSYFIEMLNAQCSVPNAQPVSSLTLGIGHCAVEHWALARLGTSSKCSVPNAQPVSSLTLGIGHCALSIGHWHGLLHPRAGSFDRGVDVLLEPREVLDEHR